MPQECNTVHYMPTYGVLLELSEDYVVKSHQIGATLCGNPLSGMLLSDLTMKSTEVTCQDCIDSPKYPLYVLRSIEL